MGPSRIEMVIEAPEADLSGTVDLERPLAQWRPWRLVQIGGIQRVQIINHGLGDLIIFQTFIRIIED